MLSMGLVQKNERDCIEWYKGWVEKTFHARLPYLVYEA